VTLKLEDDDETRNVWNYKFELDYQITLKKDYLKTDFIVHNKSNKFKFFKWLRSFYTFENKKGDTSFDFTSLLHTYFRLDSINNAKLYGLKNVNYSDKVLL